MSLTTSLFEIGKEVLLKNAKIKQIYEDSVHVQVGSKILVTNCTRIPEIKGIIVAVSGENLHIKFCSKVVILPYSEVVIP